MVQGGFLPSMIHHQLAILQSPIPTSVSARWRVPHLALTNLEPAPACASKDFEAHEQLQLAASGGWGEQSNAVTNIEKWINARCGRGPSARKRRAGAHKDPCGYKPVL